MNYFDILADLANCLILSKSRPIPATFDIPRIASLVVPDGFSRFPEFSEIWFPP